MKTKFSWVAASIMFALCGCSYFNGGSSSASAEASDKADKKESPGSSGKADGPKTEGSSEPKEKKRAKEKAYETIFYKSGKLKIEAYTYRPEGEGPFPAIIYNHGSRKKENAEAPFEYVAKMLAEHGYYVIVPERRGYGKSEGEDTKEAKDEGETFVPRMEEEVTDVLSAREYLKTVSDVDIKRVGLVGWSLGGIMVVFGLSQSHDFKAGVNQAGASLSWKRSPDIQKAMADAAARITVPLLSMDAENDATIDSVKAVDAAMEAHKAIHKLVIYPKWAKKGEDDKAPAGHQIFGGPEGMKSWEAETVAWLDQYVKNAK